MVIILGRNICQDHESFVSPLTGGDVAICIGDPLKSAIRHSHQQEEIPQCSTRQLLMLRNCKSEIVSGGRYSESQNLEPNMSTPRSNLVCTWAVGVETKLDLTTTFQYEYVEEDKQTENDKEINLLQPWS